MTQTTQIRMGNNNALWNLITVYDSSVKHFSADLPRQPPYPYRARLCASIGARQKLIAFYNPELM